MLSRSTPGLLWPALAARLSLGGTWEPPAFGVLGLRADHRHPLELDTVAAELGKAIAPDNISRILQVLEDTPRLAARSPWRLPGWPTTTTSACQPRPPPGRSASCTDSSSPASHPATVWHYLDRLEKEISGQLVHRAGKHRRTTTPTAFGGQVIQAVHDLERATGAR